MAVGRDLDFDDFVEFHFGRIVGKPWYFEFDHDRWEPEPRSGIAYLTRLFANGPQVLEWFHDDQIAQGLTGLVNCSAIGGQPWMGDPVTPAEERAAVWPAIAKFFEDVLASKCAPMLGHLARIEDDPPMINTVTYMWWESFPGLTGPDDPQRALVDDGELDCLERVLQIASLACQEAALHGLGHWAGRELRCAEIIERYLKQNVVAPELRQYAQAARGGCVL